MILSISALLSHPALITVMATTKTIQNLIVTFHRFEAEKRP